MLATKQAAFTNDGQRLEINILVHKQWTKIGDRHFGAQAIDKDWKSTRTSNGQRLEINVLVHKVLQGVVLGDLHLFYFLFPSYQIACMDLVSPFGDK
jgi:hypothetical protein